MSGTYSVRRLKAGTCRSEPIPKVSATFRRISGSSGRSSRSIAPRWDASGCKVRISSQRQRQTPLCPLGARADEATERHNRLPPPRVPTARRILAPRPSPDGLGVEPLLHEIGIGLVDQLQPLLGGFVAAVQVGVVLLRQPLVAPLQLGEGEAVRELKPRHHLLRLGPRPRQPPAAVARDLIAEQAEH